MAVNTEENQRQSDNLMNIVAVVYGVAITIALSTSPDILLHPGSAAELIRSVALLAAVLLAAFSFYSYVLSIGGDKPYNVSWTLASGKWFAIIRFVVDLVLAGLYVHLLLAAVNIETGPNAKPKLAGFVFAFSLVFAGAVLVRFVRRKEMSWVSLIAMLVSLGLSFLVRSLTATRGTDLAVEIGLLVGVLLYGWCYQQSAYENWKKITRRSAQSPPPALKLVIYRPVSNVDKAKFDPRLQEKVAALRCIKADTAPFQGWSLDPDEHGVKGAALILDVGDRSGDTAALVFPDEELGTTEIFELKELEL